LISIGLPAIKPAYLAEAIECLLAQVNTDFELIIRNDRANPLIREIVAGFSDPRIRYVEGNGPVGVVENWNLTLEEASGDYFILFSDDDRCTPKFLAELAALAEQFPHAGLYHCRVRKIRQEGSIIGVTAFCPPFESGPDFILERLKGNREQFAPEFMCRTQELKAGGGFADLPLAWGSDDLTWFRLALAGGVACSPELMVDWRQSPGQISESGSLADRLEAVTHYGQKLRLMLSAFVSLDDQDIMTVHEALGLIDDHAARQRAHLLAIAARHLSLAELSRIYFRLRKRHKLTFVSFVYAVYARTFLSR
jgi:glycosyltransferase involved in cell wall biosynthesis